MFRNVFVVATGHALGQVIALAFTPWITRIYGPEAFGTLGAFLALISVAVPAVVLGYSLAIVLARNDDDAFGLIRISGILGVSLAILFTFGLSVSDGLVQRLLGVEAEREYVLAFGATALFAAWVHVAQQWLIRKSQFKSIARATVLYALATYGLMCLVGTKYPLASVLVGVAAFGFAVHGFILTAEAVRTYRSTSGGVRSSNHKRLIDLGREYRDFPLFRAPQMIVNALSQGLPVLMLAALSGPAAAGYYALTRVVIGAPVNLVAKSVGDVFYPRITNIAYAGDGLLRPVLTLTLVLGSLAAIPFGILMLFGPALFGFVFGEDWLRAGNYASWLAIFFFFSLINKPCIAAVPVLRLQRGLLVYELLSTAAKIIGLWLGLAWLKSDLFAVAVFSAIGALSYVLMMAWILRHAASFQHRNKDLT